MEKSYKNGLKQPLEMAPAIKGKLFSCYYVVIGGFSLKYIKRLAQEIVRLQPTVRLQFCILISAKYSSLCTSHI